MRWFLHKFLGLIGRILGPTLMAKIGFRARGNTTADGTNKRDTNEDWIYY